VQPRNQAACTKRADAMRSSSALWLSKDETASITGNGFAVANGFANEFSVKVKTDFCRLAIKV
jgi:hypothetical protein